MLAVTSVDIDVQSRHTFRDMNLSAVFLEKFAYYAQIFFKFEKHIAHFARIQLNFWTTIV